MNSTENKSRSYIIGFTAIILIVIAIIAIVNKPNKATTPTVANNTPVVSSANTTAVANKEEGNKNDTLDADINFRNIDFSASKDEIIKAEKKAPDIDGNPNITTTSDNYTYVVFTTNANSPLNYNGISVSGDSSCGLTYIFNKDKLDEVRLQFGKIGSNINSQLIDNINDQYGKYTYYNSNGGLETYWWKTSSKLLMLSCDKTGTTLYYRKSK